MDSTTGRICRRATAAVASALATATVLAALVVAPPAPASAGSTRDTEPRTPFPGFVLERGRYRTIEAPDPGVLQYPFDINDRGQIVGVYENPDAAPSPQRIDGSPPHGMALAQASSDGATVGNTHLR